MLWILSDQVWEYILNVGQYCMTWYGLFVESKNSTDNGNLKESPVLRRVLGSRNSDGLRNILRLSDNKDVHFLDALRTEARDWPFAYGTCYR